MPAGRSVILGGVPPTAVSTLAEELASEILRSSRSLPSASVEALCGMACSPVARESQAGATAIFRTIVEHWGDRFEPDVCESYIDFFSNVIDFYRRQPAAGAFDDLLRELGVPGLHALVTRARGHRLGSRRNRPSPAAVQKVLVLSRVTLGADVAVTSVFLASAKQLYPSAEIVLVGGGKTAEMFAGDPRIRPLTVGYGRGGTLAERLNAWIATVHAIRHVVGGLSAEEFVIFDPDSRLTQLGLLPLVPPDDPYFFFESRSYGAGTSLPIAQLSGNWIRELHGPECERHLPYVRLSNDDIESGHHLRQLRKGPIASLNFGVGSNDSKRVGEPFEFGLLRALFRRGYSVVLDYGAGAVEAGRTERLVEKCRNDGISIGQLRRGKSDNAALLTWQGSLSGFAGIIASSDLYAGYDSAGGHLAAALGIPGIDIFRGAVCERMLNRWSPWGAAPATVVPVEPSALPDEVLARAEELIP